MDPSSLERKVQSLWKHWQPFPETFCHPWVNRQGEFSSASINGYYIVIVIIFVKSRSEKSTKFLSGFRVGVHRYRQAGAGVQAAGGVGLGAGDFQKAVTAHQGQEFTGGGITISAGQAAQCDRT
jgi:hypothetical protein